MHGNRRAATVLAFVGIASIAACGSVAPSPADAGGDGALGDGIDGGADARDAGELDADADAADAFDASEDADGACTQPCDPQGGCEAYGNPCLMCNPVNHCCDLLYVSCATPARGKHAAIPTP